LWKTLPRDVSSGRDTHGIRKRLTILENASQEKRPRLRWEGWVKEGVEKIKPGEEWKELYH